MARGLHYSRVSRTALDAKRGGRVRLDTNPIGFGASQRESNRVFRSDL